MDSVFIGKIVNTHGIKGEIRIKSDFEYKNRAFVVGNYIKIKDKKYRINSYRVHKEFDMVTLEGLYSINDVIPFKGLKVYIDKETLNLQEGEYLLEDLIGMKIMINDVEMGIVNDYNNGINPIIEVKYNNIVYYVPLKGDFIEKVDILNNTIVMNESAKGLIL